MTAAAARPTWEQVAAGIRDRIEAGDLKPDEPVRIREQAAAWQASRHAATRAVRALAAEGHLRRYPGHGYIVVGWCPTCLYRAASDACKQACAR